MSKDLGFFHQDRIERARRMGWLCDQVLKAGATLIADFVCPAEATRAAFGDAFVVWLDRIQNGRFHDANMLFTPPTHYNIRVTSNGGADEWAERINAVLR